MTSSKGAAILAYTFWHWRRPDVDANAYERALHTFQASLAESPPDGFLRSVSSSLRGAPWANAGDEAYQDRYLLSNSAALDPIDRWVADGPRGGAHDSVARLAAGGSAGLYQARLGLPLDTPQLAQWFAKPAGMSYQQLFALVEPAVRDGASVLWMRRLVLGPTPEFCLESSAPVHLGPPIEGLELSLRPVWP